MNLIFFVLGVISSACVVSSREFSDELFLSEVACISASGDEDLCDGLQNCLNTVPNCYLIPYYYCVRKFLPGGIRHCSKTEEAYGNKENVYKIGKCYTEITTLPNGDDWTTIPDFQPLLNCVDHLGVECKRRESESNESSNSGSSKSSSSSESSE